MKHSCNGRCITHLLSLFLATSLLSLNDDGVMGKVFPRGGLVRTGTGVFRNVLRVGSAGLHVSS